MTGTCSILNIILGWLLIILIIGSIVLLSLLSNMLKDSINDLTTFYQMAIRNPKFYSVLKKDKSKIPRPYSLARTQLAFWTLIISSTYVYLVFCKNCGQSLSLDASTLAILGISIGTTAGGTLIDKSQQNVNRHQNRPSSFFLIDILSDENGISIARLQQLIWTTIAAILYLSEIPNLTPGHLPILDSAVLGLSGLSSAAYLTMKAGENSPANLTITSQNKLTSGGLPSTIPPTPLTTLNPGEHNQPS